MLLFPIFFLFLILIEKRDSDWDLETDDLLGWLYWQKFACAYIYHREGHITSLYTAQWRFQSALMEKRVCFSQVNWHKVATFQSSLQRNHSLTLLHHHLPLIRTDFRVTDKRAKIVQAIFVNLDPGHNVFAQNQYVKQVSSHNSKDPSLKLLYLYLSMRLLHVDTY